MDVAGGSGAGGRLTLNDHATDVPTTGTAVLNGLDEGVEAGVATFAGQRKRVGMHWTLSGAEAIIALRCRCKSALDGVYGLGMMPIEWHEVVRSGEEG